MGAVEQGTQVLFAVTAGNCNGFVNYQWYKDGQLLMGETGNTLNLSAVKLDDTGAYACRVTNSSDGQLLRATSPAVDLKVIPDTPQLAGPSTVTVNEICEVTIVNKDSSAQYSFSLSGDLPFTFSNSECKFYPKYPGVIEVKCVATKGDQVSAAAVHTVTVYAAMEQPVISVSGTNPGYANQLTVGKRYSLSVYIQANETYAWTANGTDIGPHGIISYDPGAPGTVSIVCTATNPQGNSKASAAVICNIYAPAQQPVITLAGTSLDYAHQLTTGKQYSLSVVPIAQETYAWTANGTPIGTGNSISYTPGAPGAVSIVCTATNPAGDTTASAAVDCTVYAPAQQPVITLTGTNPGYDHLLTAGKQYTLSVVSQADETYIWTENDIDIGMGSSIFYTPGAPDAASIVCTAITPAGDTRDSAAVGCTVYAAPDASFSISYNAGYKGYVTTGKDYTATAKAGQAAYAWSSHLGPSILDGSYVPFTAGAVGSEYLRLVVTNEAGDTHTVTENYTVCGIDAGISNFNFFADSPDRRFHPDTDIAFSYAVSGADAYEVLCTISGDLVTGAGTYTDHMLSMTLRTNSNETGSVQIKVEHYNQAGDSLGWLTVVANWPL